MRDIFKHNGAKMRKKINDKQFLEGLKNKSFLEKFIQEGNNYIGQEESYSISYPEFLEYFRNIKNISRHNLIIGINFVYGWMPTIFDFRSKKFNEAVLILNNAKKGQIPTSKELEILKGLFNNSLVGTSKLLHFINSDKFAIWDSRVLRYLTGTFSQNRIGNCETYLAYLDLLNYLTNSKEYINTHNSICKKYGYKMSYLRTAELIMYMNGEKNNNK